MEDGMSIDSDLRYLAEKMLKGRSTANPSLTEEQARRLVHELEVHRIELELQNEELRQTRHALEASLEKYTDLYDFAPVGYLTLDRNGTIKGANLTVATLLNTPRSNLVGRGFAAFLVSDARDSFTTFLKNTFAQETVKSWEGGLLSEKPTPLLLRIEALSDKSGDECRLAIIDISLPHQLQEELDQTQSDLSILEQMQRDLTESHVDLARHAEQLNASNIRLQELNTQMEAFAYTVSHDLKTPLVTILGFVGQLQQDLEGNDQSKIQSDLCFISDAARKMRAMLDDLLDLSRSSRAVTDSVQLDLSSLVKDSISLLGGQLAHVELSINIPTDLPAIYGDPVRLHHVFLNLLGNAAKFTREASEPRIEVACMPGDGVVTCMVRDNGIGISSQYHDRVFTIFEKLNPSKEGTGIGLAIVRRVLEQHGGRVWVESTGEGQGSTFFFTLPTGPPCLGSSAQDEKS